MYRSITGSESPEKTGRETREAELVYECKYPTRWNRKLVREILSRSKEIKEDLPETPIIKLDFTKHGYGVVHVKDESRQPRTHTHKERLGKYRAQCILRDIEQLSNLTDEQIEKIPIKRDSIITMGNAGIGFSYPGLPPVNLLMDKNVPTSLLKKIIALKPQANIYLYDLSKKLSSREILRLTNSNGEDLSDISGDEHPFWPYYYSKLAENLLNSSPNKIYTPVGTTLLFYSIYERLVGKAEGIVRSQNWLSEKLQMTPAGISHLIEHFGLNLEQKRLRKIEIYGAEPAGQSIADKLYTPYKPGLEMINRQLNWWKSRLSSEALNPNHGITPLSEDEIKLGYDLLNTVGRQKGLKSEPSGAAGFSLYLKHFKEGKITRKEKVLIVNTGCGITID